ncbi:hypothetical protein H0H87_007265 [Tephrocybe sp. NHM501043]|nr:hypothetical protein H0H87_007265 [Tephrocybe sp. NHM501043]
MGPTSLAGHSILATTSAFTFQLHFSNVSAATIRVGNLLGEKNAFVDGTAAMAAGFLRVRGKQLLGALMNLRTDWRKEVRKAAERNAREELRQKALQLVDEGDQV